MSDGGDFNAQNIAEFRANPRVRIEVGDDVFDAQATDLMGAERDEKYAEQGRRYPGFADYEQKTGRIIPVVALSRVP
jgi:deazaflavin-dependent oxidoreductase (nitroreductase family)